MSFRICGLMENLGYKVKNKNGNENLLINVADIAFFIGYLALSVYNLYSANSTDIGFAINYIILLRLFLKNLIELCKMTKSKRNYANLTFPHTAKIVMEGCISLLLGIAYITFYKIMTDPANPTYKPIFMGYYIGVILFVTSVENLLTFLERIYDAEPRVLQYAE